MKKVEEGGWVKGEGANVFWKQCGAVESSGRPNQAEHPHYITGADLADCSPACKHGRLTKVHLAELSTF